MRLLINNKELLFTSLVIRDDIELYYSIVEFDTLYRITVKDTIELITESGTYQLKVLQSIFNNKQYHLICCTVSQYTVLNTVFNAFTGNTTVSSLLSNVGIKCTVPSQGISSFWNIPRAKLTTLIDLLNSYSSFPNGGGVRYYLSLDGDLKCIDFKLNFSKHKAYDLKADIISDYSSSDWILAVPGIVDIYKYSGLSISKETLTIKEGFGRGSVFVNDTTSYEVSSLKSKLINEFYLKFYTSRLTEVLLISAESADVGNLVKLNDGLDYVIISREEQVPINGESPVIKLKLSRSYEQDSKG